MKTSFYHTQRQKFLEESRRKPSPFRSENDCNVERHT